MRTVEIVIIYGTMWNATKQICEETKKILEHDFLSNSINAKISMAKTADIDTVTKSEVIILATSVFVNGFRKNVLDFAKENQSVLQNKISGLMIVNKPYDHRDYYIREFEKKVGINFDIAITTGGIMIIELCRKWLHPSRDAYYIDYPGGVCGEIMYEDLISFSKKIIAAYFDKHGEKND